MTWNEIVSAICICISSVIFSLSLQCKTRTKIMLTQLFACFFYISNYMVVLTILPSALMGFVASICELLRVLAFYFIERKEKFDTKINNLIIGIIFSVILSLCTIFAWIEWYCIFPLVGAVLVSMALGSKNILSIKIAYLVQAICITIYLFMLSLWINAITQVVVFISSIIGLIMFIYNKQSNKNTQ